MCTGGFRSPHHRRSPCMCRLSGNVQRVHPAGSPRLHDAALPARVLSCRDLHVAVGRLARTCHDYDHPGWFVRGIDRLRSIRADFARARRRCLPGFHARGEQHFRHQCDPVAFRAAISRPDHSLYNMIFKGGPAVGAAVFGCWRIGQMSACQASRQPWSSFC